MKITSRQWKFVTLLVVVAIVCLLRSPEFIAFASVLDAIGIDLFITLLSAQFLGICGSYLKPVCLNSFQRFGRPLLFNVRCLLLAIPGVARIVETTSCLLWFCFATVERSVYNRKAYA